MGEKSSENDLFYVCSLIEYISRITKNRKKDVVNKLGMVNLDKMYRNASVYHSDNIDKVASEFIENVNLEDGNYDVVSNSKYRVPSYFEIGKVYQRLILNVNSLEENYIVTLMEVMNSFIIEKIDNYNSSMFYENPSYIYQCYLEGKVL